MKRVGFLIFEGCEPLDFVGPMTVFNSVNSLHLNQQLVGKDHHIKTHLLSLDEGSIRCRGGMNVTPDGSVWEKSLNLDLLIIPGGDDAAIENLMGNQELRKLTSQCHSSGIHLASICNGVYILASAHIIDNCTVTTHWKTAAGLRHRFPLVRVDADKLFIRTERLATSAGVASGIDMTLDIVSQWCGEEIAFNIAKELVLPYKRSGSQRQLNTLLLAQGKSIQLSELLNWMVANLNREMSVDMMADYLCMSRRSFFRWFRKETGLSPTFILAKVRLEQACLLLEDKDKSLKEVARLCGYRSARQLSSQLKKHLS